ncbi:hypothetical protein KAR91_36370 [Candidatus Pacearchaeota archaeon]|nr:hypothetical protein [Candidatus Pacearchaeota archaeon]
MADKKSDLALMRVKYAAYRNKMRKAGNVEKTVGFKAWMQTNSKPKE